MAEENKVVKEAARQMVKDVLKAIGEAIPEYNVRAKITELIEEILKGEDDLERLEAERTELVVAQHMRMVELKKVFEAFKF